jgi:hypothetical protein
MSKNSHNCPTIPPPILARAPFLLVIVPLGDELQLILAGLVLPVLVLVFSRMRR